MSVRRGFVSTFGRATKFPCWPPESQEPARHPHVDVHCRMNPAPARSGSCTEPPTQIRNSKNNGKAKAMGFFSKDIKTLDDLFVHTLRDIYYAEKQIEKSLPKMVDKATDPQ